MFAYLLIVIDVCAVNCLIAQQADLSFGRRQVEQIICDRPDMGEVIKRDPALRQMLEWHFAGKLKGCRVYWDCREPAGGRPAEHFMSRGEYPALVRVSKRCGSSALDKCTMLVFELHNLQLDNEFKSLAKAVVEKTISPEDYATSCVRLEFAALKKTQLFFWEHPLTEVNYQNDVYYYSIFALSGDFSDYMRWLNGLDSKAYNPRQHFLQAYDELLPAPTR